MPGTTVRISDETRDVLRQLERETGVGPQDLVARAIDQFRRRLILANTNVAYGRLRSEGVAGDDGPAWESTLADGLDD